MIDVQRGEESFCQQNRAQAAIETWMNVCSSEGDVRVVQVKPVKSSGTMIYRALQNFPKMPLVPTPSGDACFMSYTEQPYPSSLKLRA